MEAALLLQCTIIEKQTNQINTLHYATKKIAHDSQVVRAKENLKWSHGVPSYRQASGTNPSIEASHQSHHCV